MKKLKSKSFENISLEKNEFQDNEIGKYMLSNQ